MASDPSPLAGHEPAALTWARLRLGQHLVQCMHDLGDWMAHELEPSTPSHGASGHPPWLEQMRRDAPVRHHHLAVRIRQRVNELCRDYLAALRVPPPPATPTLSMALLSDEGPPQQSLAEVQQQLSERLRVCGGAALQAMESRVAAWLEMPDLDPRWNPRWNPLGPNLIAEAMLRVCADTDMSEPVRGRYLAGFEQLLAQRLPLIYQELCQRDGTGEPGQAAGLGGLEPPAQRATPRKAPRAAPPAPAAAPADPLPPPARSQAEHITRRERLGVAIQVAEAHIQQLQERQHAPLPTAISGFLADHGVQWLADRYVADGMDSPAWHAAMRTLELLCWSVFPKADEAERQRLLRLLPELLVQLRLVMEQVGANGADADRFLADLVYFHTGALRVNPVRPERGIWGGSERDLIPEDDAEAVAWMAARLAADLDRALEESGGGEHDLAAAEVQPPRRAEPPPVWPGERRGDCPDRRVTKKPRPAIESNRIAATPTHAGALDRSGLADSSGAQATPPSPQIRSDGVAPGPAPDRAWSTLPGVIDTNRAAPLTVMGGGEPDNPVDVLMLDLGLAEHTYAYEVIGQLRRGDILTLREPDTAPQRLRLIWISPLRENYMFLPQDGSTPRSVSRRDLAQGVVEGTLRLPRRVRALEHAVRQALADPEDSEHTIVVQAAKPS